jgi:hypothetical protein
MAPKSEPYVDDLNYVERKGLHFFRRKCDSQDRADEAWDDKQNHEIRAVTRVALAKASLSGAVSGALIAGFEVLLRHMLAVDMESDDWVDLIFPFYVSHFAFAAVVTVLEFVYLYQLMLKSAARISSIGGLGLASRDEKDVMANAVSRAAMDMPNPRTEFYGIDPYFRISKARLLLYTFLYRTKVGITTILMRLLMRRLMARMAVRSLVPFIAIPLYAIWNVAIFWKALREARARVAAPVAIRQISERIRNEPGADDPEVRREIFEMVAETMMRARDSHPSFLLLLQELFDQFDIDPDSLDTEFDWKESLERLGKLDEGMQDLVLDVLQAATVMGGPPGRRRKKLVKQAFEACGRDFDNDQIDVLYQGFIRGKGIAALKERGAATSD